MFDLGSASSRCVTAALGSVARVHLPLCVFWFTLLFCRIGDGVSALVSFQSLCICSVLLRGCPSCLCLPDLLTSHSQSYPSIFRRLLMLCPSFVDLKIKALCLVCVCCHVSCVCAVTERAHIYLQLVESLLCVRPCRSRDQLSVFCFRPSSSPQSICGCSELQPPRWR